MAAVGFKVLVIDDNPEIRELLQDTLEEDAKGRWRFQAQDFENIQAELRRFRPDAVVLDLREGESPDQMGAGNRVYEEIWNFWFCPVVVYTGFLADKRFEDHPLVKVVEKGDRSEFEVLSSLENFIPKMEMIRSVHRDFDKRIHEALRDSVHILEDHEVENNGNDQSGFDLSRAVRRLVAARVDASASEEGSLRAWERYVLPPLGAHLLTADLLKQKGDDGNWTNADNYRLVLTPSCDLVRRGEDKPPAAPSVLVARCESLEKLGNIQLTAGEKMKKRERERVQSILTEGMADKFLPFPSLKGHIPVMVANLKRLELLEWDQIFPGQENEAEGNTHGSDEKPMFERVASTDSPFREMVVWAYLRVTGRPGLPETDIEHWLDDIDSSLTSKT